MKGSNHSRWEEREVIDLTSNLKEKKNKEITLRSPAWGSNRIDKTANKNVKREITVPPGDRTESIVVKKKEKK
jgi:hypothetical protein